MMKTNAWKTPFGLVFLVGSSVALAAGVVTGLRLQAPEPDEHLADEMGVSVDENALVAENAEPQYPVAAPQQEAVTQVFPIQPDAEAAAPAETEGAVDSIDSDEPPANPEEASLEEIG